MIILDVVFCLHVGANIYETNPVANMNLCTSCTREKAFESPITTSSVSKVTT